MKMLRTLLVLISLFGLLAFKVGDPFSDRNLLIYNTTVAHFFNHAARLTPYSIEAENSALVDTTARAHVLMLDYSTYGGAYVEKTRGIIARYLPRASFTDFKEGSSEDLMRVLPGCNVVVVAYPSAAPSSIRQYSKVLNQFVQQGGSVVFTGTHEFEVLQQFGLFDLDFGYFSKDRPFHCIQTAHPIFQDVPSDFSLTNFAYPLDVSDPGFVTLADVGGYPVIGFKSMGAGKVIYIGVEYYYDEEASSKLLTNAITWASNESGSELSSSNNGQGFDSGRLYNVKRSEEFLYAGSGSKAENVELKIYPNPYFSKATLDIELNKPTPIMIEMTDELGRNVALILPMKSVGPGLCRFELPNISAGIYFLQIQIGEKKYVRKVVKSSVN
jgi:hypothetical protein